MILRDWLELSDVEISDESLAGDLGSLVQLELSGVSPWILRDLLAVRLEYLAAAASISWFGRVIRRNDWSAEVSELSDGVVVKVAWTSEAAAVATSAISLACGRSFETLARKVTSTREGARILRAPLSHADETSYSLQARLDELPSAWPTVVDLGAISWENCDSGIVLTDSARRSSYLGLLGLLEVWFSLAEAGAYGGCARAASLLAHPTDSARDGFDFVWGCEPRDLPLDGIESACWLIDTWMRSKGWNVSGHRVGIAE